MLGVLKSLQIPIQEAGQQEPELQRLRDGHGEGGAAWLRAELEPKSRADLRRLCAELGLPQKRDGAALRKEQLLEAIVENFSSQEGRSQGMGVERRLTLRTSRLCCSRCRVDPTVESCAFREGLCSGMGVCFWYPSKIPAWWPLCW